MNGDREGTTLETLSFQRLRSLGRCQRVLALAEMPPIVRAALF